MASDPVNTEPIWTLLRKHVPEVTSGVIHVVGIVREAGRGSALAVASRDHQIDPVRAVVGQGGERVKLMVSELGGERMEVIRWDGSAARFIGNLLAPLRLLRASFDDATREGKVLLAQHPGSQLPLKLQLLMNLTGWKLHIEVEHEGY